MAVNNEIRAIIVLSWRKQFRELRTNENKAKDLRNLEENCSNPILKSPENYYKSLKFSAFEEGRSLWKEKFLIVSFSSQLFPVYKQFEGKISPNFGEISPLRTIKGREKGIAMGWRRNYYP